jgi:uncharacterized paraquat-inducible protein A
MTPMEPPPRDEEWPDEADWDDDDIGAEDDDTEATCPACGAAVYVDANQCPACGAWITPETSVAAQRSRAWRWPILVALLIAVILVIWHGLGR